MKYCKIRWSFAENGQVYTSEKKWECTRAIELCDYANKHFSKAIHWVVME